MPDVRLEDLRILVVEDVTAIRTLIIKLLRSLGCERVHSAGDVEGAMDHLEQQAYDAMLLDYELAGENGLKIVRSLRKDPASVNHNLPIILLTGHAEAEVVQASVHAGADAYLVKPVMPDRLGARILQAVKSRAPNVEDERSTEVVWNTALS